MEQDLFGICPFVTSQKILSGKWTLLILHHLSEGAMRFNELQRALPHLTQATLSRQLRSMEQNGLLLRKVYDQIPPRVEYSLSPLGRDFHPGLDALQVWGGRYIDFIQHREKFAETSSAIGKNVTVTVDRAMGSCHPNHPDICYPINYGYIEGVMAPDGEEQDAYIIGIDEPVKAFTGVVIAVIHRFDDVEEKWVVAPLGSHFTKEQIVEQVYFQEQYFHIEVRM